MKRLIYAVSLLLAASFASIPWATCGSEPPSSLSKVKAEGLHNVFRITAQLYSGSGPEGDKAFASLKKLGIKTIISVDGAKPDLDRARKHGMRYVHIPIGYNGVPRQQALSIAKAIRELDGPLYIHCHHGKHRGPTVAAIAQLCADEKCNIEAALAVLKAAGTDARYTGLFKSIKEFKRPAADELANLPKNLPESVEVVGLTQAMVTIDHSWDNLRLVRAAGWKKPADHPAVDPAHEALQLVEGFQEMRRLPEVGKRPADFRQWLDESHAAAKELEQLLRMKQKAVDSEAAEKVFRKTGDACTQCHAKYRDAP